MATKRDLKIISDRASERPFYSARERDFQISSADQGALDEGRRVAEGAGGRPKAVSALPGTELQVWAIFVCGQRPMNYLSCCSWIFRHQLPYFKLSTYKSINTSNNQYYIAADPGAGIGLVK